MATNPRLVSFLAGDQGPWQITANQPRTGAAWPAAKRLQVVSGDVQSLGSAWTLRGVLSNERYVSRQEKAELVPRSAPLGRPNADRAALIPIRKSAAWWALPQDERLAIFAEGHNRIGLKYLPAIARRLHHCRDLDTVQPFDFLTWFDFASEDANAFEDLVGALRQTEEWKYVDWEIDIRLQRQ